MAGRKNTSHVAAVVTSSLRILRGRKMVRGRRNCSSHCRLSPLYKVNYGKVFQGYLYQYIISESICIIIAESVSNMITVFIFRRVTSRRCGWKSRDSKFPLCSSTLLDVLPDYSKGFILYGLISLQIFFSFIIFARLFKSTLSANLLVDFILINVFNFPSRPS